MLKNFQKILLVTASIFFSACAAVPHTQLDTNPAFSSHQYKSHDVSIQWKSVKTDAGIRIEGMVTNIRTNLPYDFFEIRAKLLDEKGNDLASGSIAIPDRFSSAEPFRMDIPIGRKEMVRRIDFSYSYGIGEDHFLEKFASEP